MAMIARIAAVQRELRSLDIPAVLITNLSDVKYLSGFTGTTAYMLVDLEKAVFFTDGRY
ncbi:MAG: aminopeptidase P family N-terminal domain-containing protein, partial [Mucispirillum sp.]|nr:aminopeptidase P family N-terminal domain-containing protein [Mucispirillum sp.]